MQNLRDKALVDARTLAEQGARRKVVRDRLLQGGLSQKEADQLLRLLRPSLSERLGSWALLEQGNSRLSPARTAGIFDLLKGGGLLVLCGVLFGVSQLLGHFVWGLLMAGSGILGAFFAAMGLIRVVFGWPEDAFWDG